MSEKVPLLNNRSHLTVLLLTTEYKDQIIGGLGRHVTDLVSEGTKRGLHFIVITISKTNEESYKIEDGVHVFRLLPWQRNAKDFLEYIHNLNFRFSQFVLQELHLPFNLIHVHDWLTGIAGIQLKTFMNLPLLTTIHATENGRKSGKVDKVSKRITEYETMLIHKSDQIIVCSQFMKNVLLDEFKCPIKKVEVIANGIIPKNYQSVIFEEDAIHGFSHIKAPYLLAMGRHVKEKGFQHLIQAFADIQMDFPDLKLVIAGSGPDSKHLKQLTKELSIDNKVIFPGFVQNQERNMLLHHCEMLVIPSLYEPFGIIALEGMITKKPVVAFTLGGLSEVLADDRGILVNEATSKSLANTLQLYLSQPSLSKRNAMVGYDAAITNYNWSYIIEEMADLYSKLVNTRSEKE
ncbi:glycosyltransferase family 4 protein [Metabacillus litoralis]|uniref:glycosyltransferase family 4 protein n=1 Tax=Metabacillus litoralis TaxID=152268 RepID=UPI00204151FD|nr:glycosyltransferase family 4 protein [Metabacillus litoralis]MCM3650469.1 glycosyltransferase family 4 protein [Metabacillus litoralis]